MKYIRKIDELEEISGYMIKLLNKYTNSLDYLLKNKIKDESIIDNNEELKSLICAMSNNLKFTYSKKIFSAFVEMSENIERHHEEYRKLYERVRYHHDIIYMERVKKTEYVETLKSIKIIHCLKHDYICYLDKLIDYLYIFNDKLDKITTYPNDIDKYITETINIIPLIYDKVAKVKSAVYKCNVKKKMMYKELQNYYSNLVKYDNDYKTVYSIIRYKIDKYNLNKTIEPLDQSPCYSVIPVDKNCEQNKEEITEAVENKEDMCISKDVCNIYINTKKTELQEELIKDNTIEQYQKVNKYTKCLIIENNKIECNVSLYDDKMIIISNGKVKVRFCEMIFEMVMDEFKDKCNISGTINVYNTCNNHNYFGIIVKEDNKVNIMFSNRPILPLGIELNSYVIINIKFL